MLPSSRIAGADLNAQCSLPSCRTHDLAGDDLFYQSSFSQAVKASGSEDDGIVFSLVEFAQARIDVAAQGINLQVRANGFQLCLAAKTAGADPGALGKVFDA